MSRQSTALAVLLSLVAVAPTARAEDNPLGSLLTSSTEGKQVADNTLKQMKKSYLESAGKPLDPTVGDNILKAWMECIPPKAKTPIGMMTPPIKGAIVFFAGTLAPYYQGGHLAIANGDGTYYSATADGGVDPAIKIISAPLGWIKPPSPPPGSGQTTPGNTGGSNTGGSNTGGSNTGSSSSNPLSGLLNSVLGSNNGQQNPLTSLLTSTLSNLLNGNNGSNNGSTNNGNVGSTNLGSSTPGSSLSTSGNSGTLTDYSSTNGGSSPFGSGGSITGGSSTPGGSVTGTDSTSLGGNGPTTALGNGNPYGGSTSGDSTSGSSTSSTSGDGFGTGTSGASGDAALNGSNGAAGANGSPGAAGAAGADKGNGPGGSGSSSSKDKEKDKGTTPAGADAKKDPKDEKISDADLQIIARIVKGEIPETAPRESHVAIASVVINRWRNGTFGKTIAEVAHASGPNQFACYGQKLRAKLYEGPIPKYALDAAKAAAEGENPIPGCTHYFNPYFERPTWADKMSFVKRLGTTRSTTHDFYKSKSAAPDPKDKEKDKKDSKGATPPVAK